MLSGWAHLGTTIIASFLASLVEAVEALTVVLAVGSSRGWRSALLGVSAAIGTLALLVLTLGGALIRVPLHALQVAVGVLLVLFGARWLRKAILRAAGNLALRDEAALFAKSESSLREGVTRQGTLRAGWDRLAFMTSFNIVMLEGTEVVFIVIAVGAGSAGAIWPASLGAVAALLLVAALGLVLHRPLARVPENTLKFIVGVLLSAFGVFWVGEGLELGWPESDWSLLGLIAVFFGVARLLVSVTRRPGRATAESSLKEA